MSEQEKQEKWLPTDEEIHLHLIHKGGIRFISDYCRIVRDLLRAAVEKAMAEEWKKNLDAKEELIRRFRELQAEQEARHRRELIEVKIAAYEYAAWNTREAPFTSTLQALAAELAALEEAKPYGWTSFEWAKEMRAKLAALDKEVKP